MKLKLLLLFVLISTNCFSQSSVIDDGNWFLIQINVNNEVTDFPMDYKGDPVYTVFSTSLEGDKSIYTEICDTCFDDIVVDEVNSKITITGGLCTLGGCVITENTPSNYLENHFKVDRFYTSGVYNYEITEENLTAPLQLKITNSIGDFLLYYFNTLSTSVLEKSKTVSIYPNPVKDNIVITSKVNLKHAHYDILDITGKIIKSYDVINNNTINVSGVEEGIYFMTITTGSKIITKKFIKNQ